MVAVREAGVHYPAIMLNYELASRMQNSLKLGREYERLVEENGFRKRRVVFVEQALLGELEIKDREWEGMVGKYGKRGEPGSGLVVGERGFTVEVRDVLHKNFNARCVLEGKLMRLKSIVEKMDEQERELREQVAPSWEAWQVLLEGVFEGCGLLERREKSKEGYNPAEEKGLAEEGKYPSRVFGDRGERDRSDVERMITELVS
ncbi:hypothetical protein K490DRAFT_68377 [Saccharata proteae CBS 121410]|uniref:Uncharacterized protein n=1 Tax=Saccharata proteae CBS 121410 TaxID=1314787 RepID=A0A9P4HQX5_9PEZI|nr:hypothetical protein K490DRAFT_68377 [Saccharata proteae CBS 121410]